MSGCRRELAGSSIQMGRVLRDVRRPPIASDFRAAARFSDGPGRDVTPLRQGPPFDDLADFVDCLLIDAPGVAWARIKVTITMLIDLRKLREPLTVWVRDSLITFSSEYPNTQVSTVGLWGDGFHGTAALHLDTPENSAEYVKAWLKEGPGCYGEDHQGRYCDSCWDFEHFIGDYAFPDYPDLYQTDVDAPVDYITLDGTIARAEPDQGDQGMHRIILPLLKAVLLSDLPFARLVRTPPFRLCVQMKERLFQEFWTVDI